jgi:hypothetical protein
MKNSIISNEGVDIIIITNEIDNTSNDDSNNDNSNIMMSFYSSFAGYKFYFNLVAEQKVAMDLTIAREL